MTDNNYLDPKEAIRLMLDGEVLVDANGRDVFFNLGSFYFERPGDDCDITNFSMLMHKPQKQKRPMTRCEILAWATSDDAKGWVVKLSNINQWCCPQNWNYDDNSISEYYRAKIKPDGTGIDEATITDFSVEAAEQ